MKKHSKMYVEALGNVEKTKNYDVTEAIKLLKSLKTRKFDESVDLVLKLNIDAKKTDMNVRGSFVLPNGTGKTKKILVVTKTKADEASEADYCGAEDMLEKIEKENWFDFDTIVATPEMMPLLGKLGKVLGPKGLMPNPKLGTVTTNVKEAISNIKKGMVEYKNDSYGNLHLTIGKLSFTEEQLEENLRAIVSEIVKNKPNGVKGTFIKNISISSTMSPGIKVDKSSLGL
ncbi:50S ribosomal protein L1 [Clostridium sp. CAG:1000]|jgi:large subunit ribosomal protein L1|nr:50S ribosomal protein L1 [Clostridium sp.]CCX35559.1 50S ribosomal protein L1 [Clostridium sp. CAG:1000]